MTETIEKSLGSIRTIVDGVYRCGLVDRNPKFTDLAAALSATNERRLEMAVRWSVRHSDGGEWIFSGLHSVDAASFEFQMPLSNRRIADLVIFHVDGSATVVEMKDGSMGFDRVRAAIGQVGLYAHLMGQSRVRDMTIRRAVMWCNLSPADSEVMACICRDAGVVPLPIEGDLAQACRESLVGNLAHAVVQAAKSGKFD